MRRALLRPVLVAAGAAALCVPASVVGSGAQLGLPTKIGKGEGKLSLLEWPNYSHVSFSRQFQRETGCKITRRVVHSSQEAVQLMRADGGGGAGKYDLVSASGDVSGLLIAAHDVRPINVALIPGWREFAPVFRSPRFNTVHGVHYGISTVWTPNTLLYNEDDVSPPPTSWRAIYSARNKEKIAVPDNPMQIADAALYLKKRRSKLGIRDPYELTKTQFAAAVALLQRQRKIVSGYWRYAIDEIEDFRSGDAVVGSGWPYQVQVLQGLHVAVAQKLPSEGVTAWADSWLLAAKAPHPNCAYRWLRYVSTAKVQARQALVLAETPVNPGACAFMDRRQKGSCAAYFAHLRPSFFRRVSFWKTPTAVCGFGGRTDCVPYDRWRKAWQGITG